MYNKESSRFSGSVGDRSMMDVSLRTILMMASFLLGPCVSLDDDMLRRSIALRVNNDVVTIGSSSCESQYQMGGGRVRRMVC